MTAGSRRPATIIDVAAAAGVSRQTVTRAMNDMPGVSAATKERVLAAARQLAYRPSRYGRGLVGHARRTIGLVVDDLANLYYPQLASAVTASATARGWNVLLAQRRSAAEPRALLADLAAQADVLIGYPGLSDAQVRELLAGVPLVRLDLGDQTHGAGVELDTTGAMADLVAHLLERGARRPVMLDVGTSGSPTGRAQDFIAGMAAHGVTVPTVSCETASFSAGAAGAVALIEAHPEVDAIMAFNDTMACGALKALHEAGIGVPDAVRLAGCDGLDVGAVVHPALTTLAVDMGEVAEAAVGLAVGMDEGAVPLDGARVRVQHRLLVRAST